MPKREDIKSILLIGAGPIVIGQACEFDYSGAQACKALREEGYRVILVNSNPATIMTDPEMADVIYIEPVEWRAVRDIIAREKPDALLPTMGGQTALNVALDLAREGVLEEHGVTMIGADIDAIDKAESRERFKVAMADIGLEMPRSAFAHTVEEAIAIASTQGYPAIVRPSFTLGGTGGGIAHDEAALRDIAGRGIEASPTSEVLIEESILGWKEFEMEVVRDRADNCIIICAIENLDPMGVHTGDSITVAPTQTLTDKEYQRMRDASFDVIREIGVETGGSNVQFALNPADGRLIVIEMNPRVSRSSALASKATGFPIAKIAAKLAVGYTLDELDNDITGATPASFEPTIDYVVTKIPRFTFEKFKGAAPRLGTQMKSVGEVMAIGRTFQESLQKALRGLETGLTGLDPVVDADTDEAALTRELVEPGPDRLRYLADALRRGWSEERVHDVCKVDPWFVAQVAEIIASETELAAGGVDAFNALDARSVWRLKRQGFSDARIATLIGTDEATVRARRVSFDLRPTYKRVDTCAAEFEAQTPYLYSTWEEECEARPSDRDKVMILGAGPNRIGQGIEFDYCCVHAALALREDGVETVMVNCNPETVSTDYDTSDRLYFEPLTFEDVFAICELEKPRGVILQLGGQTPLKLANALQAAGVPILGTTPDTIDLAEDRERFKALLDELGLRQPDNAIANTPSEAVERAGAVGFPLVVRPSYVLGGRAMEICWDADSLDGYLADAFAASGEQPVLLDQYLEGAVEVDVDVVSDGELAIIGGVMEHIELAGVHSGDSACSLPARTLSDNVLNELARQSQALAKALGVVGLMNVQFAVQGETVFILEVNPRASRTVPFVSKATGMPLAKIAARCMAGRSLSDQGITKGPVPHCVSVKEAVFPFRKFPGVDVMLGPEMKSTGEAMGSGATFAEAYAKAQLAAGVTLPTSGRVVVKAAAREVDELKVTVTRLRELGFSVDATPETAALLANAGVEIAPATALDADALGGVAMVLASGRGSRALRVAAKKARVTCYTTLAGLSAGCEAIARLQQGELSPMSLAEVIGKG